MEDSMFDEQFVTTAEEIKEAPEALIELGKDTAPGIRLSFGRRRSPTRRCSPKWVRASRETTRPPKEYEAANRRLFSLFEKGWKAEDRLLFRCYWEFKKRLVYHHRAES
jgi:hypothetical protein